MKIVLVIIAFFVARVAFASSTYNCTSANNDYGQLTYTGNALEFTPNIKSATSYKSSVANLGKSQIPFFGSYVVIQSRGFKITGRTAADVLVNPAVLQGAAKVNVILSVRDVKMFSGDMKSLQLLSYSCVLK